MASGLSFAWLPGALGAIAHGAATTLLLIACTTVAGMSTNGMVRPTSTHLARVSSATACRVKRFWIS